MNQNLLLSLLCCQFAPYTYRSLASAVPPSWNFSEESPPNFKRSSLNIFYYEKFQAYTKNSISITYIQQLSRVCHITLIDVAQLVGHHPTKQKVAGLIPIEGTCLGCEFGLRWGRV